MTSLAWILSQEAAENLDLPPRQRVVAVLVSILILLGVLELVRQRKLREEYSALWVLTALGLLVLALNYRILVWLTHLIGAVLPTSTLFFGGLVFLMLLALQFSVRLSRLTYRSRSLTRRVALLEEELRELKRRFPEEGEDLGNDEGD
ncbi:MAG TPA: DUF2304 domain-containing protein [Planctomycetes bacterium]|nr:DUF2304 domain-containing protein [Planctomycetota bacterium]